MGSHHGDEHRMSWAGIMDHDEDGTVTAAELHHMALMPEDEEGGPDTAIVKELKAYYLSKPDNAKWWAEKAASEFAAAPEVAEEPW